MKKIIVLITTVSFLFSFVIKESLLFALNLSVKPEIFIQEKDDIVLPSTYGRITDTKILSGKQVIINIQDLHCHPEVQKNISNMLGVLDEKFKLKKIYVEGGYNSIDTSWLTNIKNKEIKKDIIENLLEKGVITGAEYYSAIKDRPDLLKGIENESSHKTNIIRLGKIIERRDYFRLRIKEFDENLKILTKKYFNSRNIRLNKLIEKHKNKIISTQKFYKMLYKYIESINKNQLNFSNVFTISIDSYPNIKIFLELNNFNNNLNYKNISKQMQKFLSELKNSLPYNTYSLLLKKTNNFSKEEDVYNYFSVLTNSDYKYMAYKFPDLYKFLIYSQKRRNLNPIKLVEEEKKLIEEIRAALSENMPELEVSFLADFYEYFKNYLLNNLSADDYTYFYKRFEKFKEIWTKYAYKQNINDLSKDFELLNEFYEANCSRNNNFIDNIEEFKNNAAENRNKEIFQNTQNNKNIEELLKYSEIVVLITGGFHTSGLKKLLEKRNISYITITPNITQNTKISNETYLTLARQQAKVLSNSLALRLASQMPSGEMFRLLLIAAARRLEKIEYNENNLRNILDEINSVTKASYDIVFNQDSAEILLENNISVKFKKKKVGNNYGIEVDINPEINESAAKTISNDFKTEFDKSFSQLTKVFELIFNGINGRSLSKLEIDKILKAFISLLTEEYNFYETNGLSYDTYYLQNLNSANFLLKLSQSLQKKLADGKFILDIKKNSSAQSNKPSENILKADDSSFAVIEAMNKIIEERKISNPSVIYSLFYNDFFNLIKKNGTGRHQAENGLYGISTRSNINKNLTFSVISQEFTDSVQKIIDYSNKQLRSPPDFILFNISDYSKLEIDLEKLLAAANQAVMISISSNNNDLTQESFLKFAEAFQIKRPDVTIDFSFLKSGLIIFINNEKKSLALKIEKVARDELSLPDDILQDYINRLTKFGTDDPDVQKSLLLLNRLKKIPIPALFQEYHINRTKAEIRFPGEYIFAFNLKQLKDTFKKIKKIVVVEVHPDDAILSCGQIMVDLSKINKKVMFVTCIPDQTGVAIEYLQEHFDCKNKSNEELTAMKRQVRTDEALLGAKALHVEESNYANLGLDFPLEKPRFGANGRLLSYESVFKQPTIDEQNIVDQYVIQQKDAGAFVIPFPFSNHPQHRIIADMFIKSIVQYAPKARIFVIGNNDEFNQHKLVPSYYYFYSLEDEIERENSIRYCYQSQNERVGDDFYPKRTRAIAEKASEDGYELFNKVHPSEISNSNFTFADSMVEIHITPRSQNIALREDSLRSIVPLPSKEIISQFADIGEVSLNSFLRINIEKIIFNIAFKIAVNNVVTHISINWHYIKASDIVETVKKYSAVTIEGDKTVSANIIVINELPENAKELDMQDIGININGSPVWVSIKSGGLVLYLDNVPDISDAIREINQMLTGLGKIKGSDLVISKFRDLLIKVSGINFAKIDFGTATISVDNRIKDKKIFYDNYGNIVVSNNFLLNEKIAESSLTVMQQELTAIKQMDTYAMSQSIFLNVDKEKDFQNFINNFFSDPRQIGNGQLILPAAIFDHMNENEIKDIAKLARKNNINIYIDISDSSSKKMFVDPSTGFAGYSQTRNNTKTIIDFVLGEIECIKVTGYQNIETLRKALYNAGSQPKVLDLSELKNIKENEDKVLWSFGITAILKSNILSIFNPHEITEKYVKDAVYGLPINFLPPIEDVDKILDGAINLDKFNIIRIYLNKLEQDLNNAEKYQKLKEVFKETIIERMLAIQKLKAVSSPKNEGLNDIRLEQLLGEKLLAQKRGNIQNKKVYITAYEFEAQHKENANMFYEKLYAKIFELSKKENENDPVAINTIIELISELGEPKSLSRKKKEELFNPGSINKLLSAA